MSHHLGGIPGGDDGSLSVIFLNSPTCRCLRPKSLSPPRAIATSVDQQHPAEDAACLLRLSACLPDKPGRASSGRLHELALATTHGAVILTDNARRWLAGSGFP